MATSMVGDPVPFTTFTWCCERCARSGPEAFDQPLDQISEAKHQLAGKLQEQAANKKAQQRKAAAMGSGDPIFSLESVRSA